MTEQLSIVYNQTVDKSLENLCKKVFLDQLVFIQSKFMEMQL